MLKLIVLTIIAIIYLVHGWWRSRHPEADDETESWPGQARPPRPGGVIPPSPRPPPSPGRVVTWEDELRRLLQGEPSISRPPSPPPPLPPARAAAPPPSPPKLARPAPGSLPASGTDSDMDQGLPVSLPGLSQSAQAYQQASELDLSVASRMRRVEQQVVAHKLPVLKREVPAEIRQALGLVRGRQSQRAAILAGVILGPPRALEL